MAERRILCTADLHLGRSSACLQAPEGVDVSATGAWDRIVTHAISGNAAAVAIAGDIFDSVGGYYETRDRFLKGVTRLRNEGIPVVVVAGNHDWEALPRLARQCQIDSFHFLGEKGTWTTKLINTKAGQMRFVGWSFPEAYMSDSALPHLQSPSGSAPVLGLLHGDLAAVSRYHPIARLDLDKHTDAWLLGHIHLPARVSDRIVYAGSPQALDFGPGEQREHGYFWLSFGDESASFSQLRPISTVRFEERELTVPVQDGQDPHEALIELAQAEGRARRESQENLQTVQMRARVAFENCLKLPKMSEEPEFSRDGVDAFVFSDPRIRRKLDLWGLSSSVNAAGEAARLLLALNEPELAQPGWLGDVEDLVSKSAAQVTSRFNATIGQVTDDGDSKRLPPTDEEARQIARDAMVAQLERMLCEAVEAEF